MKTTPKTPHVFAVPPRRRSRKPTMVGGVVGYVRVSTREQARTGYSIESQTADITKYAADRGLTLYGVHVDAGKSGELPPHRAPALNAAVSQAIQTGSAMVVRDPARVARQLGRGQQVLDILTRNNCPLISIELGLDSSAPCGSSMWFMCFWTAEQTREATRRNTSGVVRFLHSQGRWTGGSVAYGVSVDGRNRIPNQQEVATVRRAQELRKSGASLRSIGETLLSENHKPRIGAKWHAPMIARIIATETPPEKTI